MLAAGKSIRFTLPTLRWSTLTGLMRRARSRSDDYQNTFFILARQTNSFKNGSFVFVLFKGEMVLDLWGPLWNGAILGRKNDVLELPY